MNKPRMKYVNENVKVHMSSVYTRKNPAKRSFTLVVNGVLFSTLLMGQLALGGGQALAAPSSPLPQTNTAQQQMVISDLDHNVFDEQMDVTNLNKAVAALKKSGWSIQAVTHVIDSLSSIEEKLDEGFSFRGDNLRVALLNTRIVVTAQGGDGLITLRGQDNTILSTVERIKNCLVNGVPSVATTNSSSGKGKVMIASLQKQDPSVVIDNVVQSYSQPPIMDNGSLLSPNVSVLDTFGSVQ